MASENKQVLREAFLGMLKDIDLSGALAESVRREGETLHVGTEQIDLATTRRLVVLAIGKAAHEMASGVRDALDGRPAEFIIVSPTKSKNSHPSAAVFTGGHPYPDRGSFAAAQHAISVMQELGEEDAVLYLLSGGGSAAFEAPYREGWGLDDWRAAYKVLVTCGADIVTINIIRKHLSAVKGGRLAAEAAPARQVTLYVSDVPTEQASSVASGPTMADESTLADCDRIAADHALVERFPENISRALRVSSLAETPKPGDEAFARSSYVALIDNSHALAALQRRLEGLGWHTAIDNSVDDQPLAEAADQLLARLAAERKAHPDKTVAILSGGELSSPVNGDGHGGRNQAFVLACAQRIAGKNLAVLSGGTDGIDGNSPATGAVADGTTVARAKKKRMDPAEFAERSDSFHFFDKLDDAIITGPTGNNVRDVRVLVGGAK